MIGVALYLCQGAGAGSYITYRQWGTIDQNSTLTIILLNVTFV